MVGRDSLGGSLAAMLTGVAVTSGPWLLTTALLVLMRVSAVASGVATITSAEQVITVVYALAIVLSAPIDIVVTRFAADCVYEGRYDRIAGPLRYALVFTLVSFTLIGSTAMWALGVPLELAFPGTILAAIVGAQWLLLSAAGGLASPGIILRAFTMGVPVSLGAWFLLAGPLHLGPASYLVGFAGGQVVTLAVLLRGIFLVLPDAEDPSASLTDAALNYAVLAIATLAFHAGLWVDKLEVYYLAGGQIASHYAALAAVAWLSIVPACAYLYVGVETAFYRRFRSYYRALYEGASLSELEKLVLELQSQIKRTLLDTFFVQLCVTVICMLAAPTLLDFLQLKGASPQTIFWLLLGAGLQVVALAANLLLYYFDFRREALTTSLVQLASNALFTILIGTRSELLGAGYASACAVTGAVAVGLLLSRIHRLLHRTFQSQPFPNEY